MNKGERKLEQRQKRDLLSSARAIKQFHLHISHLSRDLNFFLLGKSITIFMKRTYVKSSRAGEFNLICQTYFFNRRVGPRIPSLARPCPALYPHSPDNETTGLRRRDNISRQFPFHNSNVCPPSPPAINREPRRIRVLRLEERRRDSGISRDTVHHRRFVSPDVNVNPDGRGAERSRLERDH